MTKKVLKTVAFSAMAVCAGLTLASCTDGNSARTIVFYNTMGDNLQTALEVAINSFETKYPGWHVESTQVGGYDDVRDTVIGDLQGGTQPDLAYCYADHVAQYMETGKVVDMGKYINSTEKAVVDGETTEYTVGFTAEEVADFVQGYYLEGYAKNYANYEKYGYTAESMLTLPFVKSTEVLYYNADALAALRVDVPTTWDELWEICELALEKYPTCTPLGYDSESNWFITMCEQNGWGYTSAQEPHFLFKSAETQAWLEDLNDKFNKNLFTTQEIYGSYTSNLFVKGAEDGGTIFSIGSSGGASHQKSDLFTWGVAPMVGSVLADGSVNNSAISQGPNLVMFTTEAENASEKELMTWLFVKEMMEPSFQAVFSMESGYNPSRQSTFEIDDYATFLEGSTIVAVTAKVASTMSDNFFTSPAFVGSSTARDQVGTALIYASTGQMTAEKALNNALSKCGA